MKSFKRIALTILLIISTFSVLSCTEVGITGRKQLNVIPDSTINRMANQTYQEFMKENKVSSQADKIALVKKVGNNIKNAVEDYANRNYMSESLEGYDWQFTLVESNSVNAFALPGGKVVVYEGMLPITQDEQGLAVVIGHEIAHVFAEHGSERMSQQLLVSAGGAALSSAVDSSKYSQIFMRAYGLGAQVGVLLPYSRVHEKEADKLGLIFMALAGYDPEEAVGFWQRMTKEKEGPKPPEFLSTHPSDQSRIAFIKDYVPVAKRYYKQ